ncbi:hypothetical protein [Paraliobacillus sp. JSM ZJ581]|uniref:hypothetical protein n=1 Tax=Paraliobacillus sp. JSM ZJ581 TaxID=3342118 RepID=UPI0035A8A40C
MKKSLLTKGIVVGAIVGGALTFFDRDTRMSVKSKLRKVNRKTTFLMTHPSDVVAEIRNQYESMSTLMLKGFDTALDFINEFQSIVNQIDEKKKR